MFYFNTVSIFKFITYMAVDAVTTDPICKHLQKTRTWRLFHVAKTRFTADFSNNIEGFKLCERFFVDFVFFYRTSFGVYIYNQQNT